MKKLTRRLLTTGLVVALVLASSSAAAQNIQRFDDQADADTETDVAIPGAPAPEQPEPEPRVVEQPADPDAEEAADEPVGSYRISVHGADQQQPGAPGRADLEELVSKDGPDLYQGIIPGERDEVAHLREIKERAADESESNQITWVGFKPEDDRTRIFFQSPRPVEYRVQQKADSDDLTVVFDNAEIPDRNFTRFIDASHFDRTVDRIEVEETDGNRVEVTLEMNEDVEPSTSIDGEYLYLDFPHDDTAADDAQADAG